MSDRPLKKSKTEVPEPSQDRVTRSKTIQETLKQKASVDTTQHFGHDVTDMVSKAMTSERKLEDTQRHKMHGDILRSKLSGSDLSQLMPKPFAQQLQDQHKSGKSVIQKDGRVSPKDGGHYLGFMMTSSIVSTKDFDPVFKDIPVPSSPNPHQGDGYYHATHTSPFALVGPDSNTTKTVNAQSWANIAVDGGIEKKAKKAAKTYGEGNVIHFRLDNSERSTVGYAVYDSFTKDEDKRWQVVAAQYKRKDHFEEDF